jgi:membrane-associated protease RseP (regulator of RpoE activity)
VSVALVAGIVVFVIGIVASVALHEVGHLVPAKIFGVHVSQYMVGFGRTLVSFRRGETEYGLKVLPLGGYVRLTGMYPPGRRPARGPFANLIESARAQALADVPEEAHGREFYTRRPWQKLVVMCGGPAMNFVLGFVLLAIALGGVGESTVTTGRPVLAEVVACVPANAATAGCTAGEPTSPAARAGLKVGDRITAIGATRVSTWAEVQEAIRKGPARTTVTFVRAGRTRTVSVHLSPIDEGNGTTVNFLGVSPVTDTVVTRSGLTTITRDWWQTIHQTGAAIITLPEGIRTAVSEAAGSRARATTGPSSIVGAGRVSVDIAKADAPVSARIATFLELLASVNIALAVFNLVPLLPLDGGHIVGALWEWVRRGLARLRNRPDPGFVDIAKAVPLAYAVGVLILISSVLLIYADVVDPQHFS